MINKTDFNYISLKEEIIEKYQEIGKLLQENGITEEVFTDKFLDIYIKIDEKLSILLSGKSEITKESEINLKEKLFQIAFKKAIAKIIEIKEKEEINLVYSIFLDGNKKKGKLGKKKMLETIEIGKYDEFLKAYYESFFGRKDVNMKVYIEHLDGKKMRKNPYRVIHIKGENFGRTFLISDQIGEATFVYDSIIKPEIFIEINKGEEIEGNIPHRIIYGANYYEKIKKLLQKELDEPENLRKKTDKQIFDEENKYLLQGKVKKYFKEIKENEEESYEYWVGLSKEELLGIKYLNRKIKSLVNICGWKNEKELIVDSLKGFRSFISWMFNKELKELSKDNVINYFKNYGGRTEEESYKYWMGLNKKEISEIEYNGKKIVSLAKKCGRKNEKGLTLQNLKGFQAFINWIFGKEVKKVKELTKEDVINYFKNYEGKNEEESYKYLMGLNQKEIRKIEYENKKIISLGNISGWVNKDGLPINSPKGFQVFISWIFGKEIKKAKELTEEDVMNYFKNYEGKNEEESYKYLMGLSAKKIGNIEYESKKIKSLCTISGWEYKEELDIQGPKGFQAFISWIFGKEIKEFKELTGEDVINYFKNYEGKNEEESYKYLMGLTAKKIGKIEFEGKKVTSLSKISGWKNKELLDIQCPKGFYVFINWMFGKK